MKIPRFSEGFNFPTWRVNTSRGRKLNDVFNYFENLLFDEEDRVFDDDSQWKLETELIIMWYVMAMISYCHNRKIYNPAYVEDTPEARLDDKNYMHPDDLAKDLAEQLKSIWLRDGCLDESEENLKPLLDLCTDITDAMALACYEELKERGAL